MRVQELMTRDVATVLPEDGMDRAVRQMQERGCGCVAVVDGKARVVGLLTDRDVCLAALAADRPLSRLRVREGMSSEVHSCGGLERLEEAQRRMARFQVRRLPVVDEDGRLQGILSLDDIAAEARREGGLFAPAVSAAEAGRTLGQICRPHLIHGAERSEET